MNSLFICIEALRQSFNKLVLYAPAWLARAVHFLCSLAPEWVEAPQDLELRYDDGALKVSTPFRDRGDLPQLLVPVLLEAWSGGDFAKSAGFLLGPLAGRFWQGACAASSRS